MKNNILSIAFALFMMVCSAAQSYAALPIVNALRSGLYLNKSGELIVNIEQNSPAKLKVLMKDGENNVVYEENVKSKQRNLALKLDVAYLKDGEYTVELDNGSEVLSKKIQINATKPIQRVRSLSND